MGKLLAAAALLPLLACSIQSPRLEIRAKAGELKKALAGIQMSAEDRDQTSAQFDTVTGDVDRGRPHVALRDLLSAWASFGVADFTAQHAAALKDDKAYAQIWAKGGADQPGSGTRANAGQPLLARGLAEYARDQANGYYRAAEAYGHQTALQAGLTYAGLAHGLVRFADFCDAVNLPGGQSPPVRSISDEIDALEARELAAYESAGDAPDIGFITMSQAIKTARECEVREWYAGALVAYLSADRLLAMKSATPLDRSEVISRLDQEQATWAKQGDNSVARLYVELAMDGLGKGADGLLQASAIVTDVLPRYHALLLPAKPRPRPPLSARHVKITLVRWPYT